MNMITESIMVALMDTTREISRRMLIGAQVEYDSVAEKLSRTQRMQVYLVVLRLMQNRTIDPDDVLSRPYIKRATNGEAVEVVLAAAKALWEYTTAKRLHNLLKD